MSTVGSELPSPQGQDHQTPLPVTLPTPAHTLPVPASTRRTQPLRRVQTQPVFSAPSVPTWSHLASPSRWRPAVSESAAAQRSQFLLAGLLPPPTPGWTTHGAHTPTSAKTLVQDGLPRTTRCRGCPQLSRRSQCGGPPASQAPAEARSAPATAGVPEPAAGLPRPRLAAAVS